jgi:hypothetical protein
MFRAVEREIVSGDMMRQKIRLFSEPRNYRGATPVEAGNYIRTCVLGEGDYPD